MAAVAAEGREEKRREERGEEERYVNYPGGERRVAVWGYCQLGGPTTHNTSQFHTNIQTVDGIFQN